MSSELVQWQRVGAEEEVLEALRGELLPERGAVGGEARAVGAGGGGGVEGELGAGLEIEKHRGIGEGEIDLGRVRELEREQVVSLVAEAANGGRQALGLVVEVAREDEEAAAWREVERLVERGGQVGVPGGGGAVQQGPEELAAQRLGGGWSPLGQFGRDEAEADGVALAAGEEGDGAEEHAGVVELGEQARAAGVGHGRGNIEQEDDPQGRLLVGLADV